MQVTCPFGHNIEIADPPTGHVLVGVVDGVEVYGPWTPPLDAAGVPELVVRCNALVDGVDADGNPETVQCGERFNALAPKEA